jgi:hypothetical protein
MPAPRLGSSWIGRGWSTSGLALSGCTGRLYRQRFEARKRNHDHASTIERARIRQARDGTRAAGRTIGLTRPRPIPDATAVSSLIPGLRSKTPADLQRARERVPWVDDDDLREVERKSRGGAAALSFFTWGGGHLYVGDVKKGSALIAAMIAWAAASNVLGPVAPAIFFAVSVLSSVWSFRKAREVNRFVGTRNEVLLRQGADASGYRLLHEAAAVNPALAGALPAAPAPLLTAGAHPGMGQPGPHAEFAARLRKLASLRRAGIISDGELRSRKIDILSEAAPASLDELDELLYALMPLSDEGVLDTEDFDFLKQLGGGVPGGTAGGPR